MTPLAQKKIKHIGCELKNYSSMIKSGKFLLEK